MESLTGRSPLSSWKSASAELRRFTDEEGIDFTEEIETLERKAEKLRQEIYASMTPWQRVQMVRHSRRPTTLDFIELIFDDFVELHGDRTFRDDPAIVGGIALLDGRPVTVIGPQKGRDTKENIRRNFGLPHLKDIAKPSASWSRPKSLGGPSSPSSTWWGISGHRGRRERPRRGHRAIDSPDVVFGDAHRLRGYR